jgi:hypothetical protein
VLGFVDLDAGSIGIIDLERDKARWWRGKRKWAHADSVLSAAVPLVVAADAAGAVYAARRATSGRSPTV